jgi:hypothetical protein
MRIDKLATLLFTIALAALVACSDDGGGGGDDADDGTTEDDGTTDDGDDGTDDGDDGDDGTPDGGPEGDGSTACLGPVEEVPNEEWAHVDEGDEIEHEAEPPASGTHFRDVWAMWTVHGAVPRGYWIHNVEHGGIVLLHSPDASEEIVTQLNAAYEAIPVDEDCGHKRAILAQDAPLQTPVAVIAADRRMVGDCVDQEAILQFVTDFRGQGGQAPEAEECAEGTFVSPP